MKKALVVGASRGIGLEFCKQLQNTYTTYATCRKSSQSLIDLEIPFFPDIEITDLVCLQDLAKKLPPLDLLVINAGILLRDSYPKLSYNDLLKQFEVNTLGPLKVVEALRPLLQKGSKIALVSSRAGSIGSKIEGKGLYGYRMSKCALNMAFRSLSFYLNKEGISLIILHPGYVKTDMTEHKGPILPEESVRGMLARIEDLSPNTTGLFWNFSGDILPW